MITLVDEDKKQAETLLSVEIHDESWEKECYQLGCSMAREVAKQYLERTEERLLQLYHVFI